jgi:hypothetical protein
MAEISKKHKLPSTVSQMWTVLFKHQGANMNEEDEAFNEIERRSIAKKEAVKAQLDKPKREWVGLTDEEIAAIVREAARGAAIRRDGSTSERIVQAIEAKLKEKNT